MPPNDYVTEIQTGEREYEDELTEEELEELVDFNLD